MPMLVNRTKRASCSLFRRRQRHLKLKAIVERALLKRGALLIPTFSIGHAGILYYWLSSRWHPREGHTKYGPRKGYVQLDGEHFTINVGIYALSSYSTHTDQRILLNE
jgi:hypothetical protein